MPSAKIDLRIGSSSKSGPNGGKLDGTLLGPACGWVFRNSNGSGGYNTRFNPASQDIFSVAKGATGLICLTL